MKKVLAVLLVIVVAAGVFLYFPRGGLEAINAAVLGVLNGDVEGSRAGQQFEPALDGDVFATGDVVRANQKGRAVLTFFDGSTISVDPNSNVAVKSLTRTSSGGIQAQIEQTAGRTWFSVSKLTSPDSKFEIHTPSITASVRGTAFETIVEVLPDGKIRTTVKTGEGEVLVLSEAGGEVNVGEGEQVDIDEGEQAPPEPDPQPPTPKLRFTGPAGVGFVVIDPRGLQCGLTGGQVNRQIPQCNVLGGAGETVLIGDVVAGDYTLFLVAAQALEATVLAEGLNITGGTDFSAKFSKAMALGDLVKTTLPVTVGGDKKLGTAGFSAAQLVSSLCGAESPGSVFAGGKLDERSALFNQFSLSQKGKPAAFVITGDDIAEFAQDNIKQANLPAEVSGVAAKIDKAGLHLSANVIAGPLTIPAKADLIAGASGGKLLMKMKSFEAGLLPEPLKGPIVEAVENALDKFAATFPLSVEKVAFRAGCLAIIGKTPS